MTLQRVAAALMAAAALPALAQGIGQAPLLEPTVPRTHSVEQADARLKEVEQQRAAVLAEYAASEEECNKRFFVNYCLDQAKEKRRLALSMLRAVEVEASYFKRRHSVEERDRELAERLKKDEQERAWRLAQAEAQPKQPREEKAAAPAAKPGPTLAQRQAAQDAKLKRQAEKDAAEAPQRARNAADFERRQQESERRQAKVAERKAEREEKERRRAAEAEAAAAKKAAAEKAAAKKP